MASLHLVLDDAIEASPRGVGRYSEELARALIATAPPGWDVTGIISAVAPAEEARLSESLPGLAGIQRLPLGRRELRIAWSRGITSRPLGGMVHAPSLFVPLTRHDRHASPGQQTVTTIHDASAWLFPDQSEHSAWVRTMAKRARKHADAIVVPTHALAECLSNFVDFGDRLRVISGAMSPQLRCPDDGDAVADRLRLPAHYVLAVGTLSPRKGLESLMQAAADPAFPPLPLVIVGPSRWGDRSVAQAIFESGAPEGRIMHIDPLTDSDLALVISRATIMVVPSQHEGFGLTAVEALHLGTPLVHSDDPSLVEVTAGAGVAVERDPASDYPRRLAHAIGDAVADTPLLDRLAVEGRDRARAFSWRDSADRVWQLHAEL